MPQSTSLGSNAVAESRKESLEDMLSRRQLALSEGEKRLKDLDLDVEAVARELVDYQKDVNDGRSFPDRGMCSTNRSSASGIRSWKQFE